MIQLIHGDCIDEMEKMDAGSVDLTVTSPPYDNLRTYEASLQWNEDIWKQVLEQLHRITKQGGVVVWVFGDATIKGSETGTSFRQALYAIECGFNLHDTMIFQKTASGAVGSQLCYWQSFEYMFILSKGKPQSINRIRDVRNKTAGSFGTRARINSDGSQKKPNRHSVAEYGIRTNIWQYHIGRNGDDQNDHPAVFPEKLASDHIISWSNEGDTVFDPFMGSGTTGKMAKELCRNFIGIEKVEKYYQIASDRIYSHNRVEQATIAEFFDS